MLSRSDRPFIGVLPRWEEHEVTLQISELLAPTEGGASCFFNALIAAGGMPVMLPITTDWQLIDAYVHMVDGITIPGGQDVNPRIWGSDESPETNPSIYLCDVRDSFELALIERAIAAHKPIFATCRGMQLVNVAYGGTLCMDVPSRTPKPGTALWRHHMSLHNPCHDVEVLEGSLLESIVGSRMLQVNSSHHCCVEKLGRGVKLVGEATDGVPEAIEVPSERFCLGVQWHPEYTWETIETDFKLWCAFVDACRK